MQTNKDKTFRYWTISFSVGFNSLISRVSFISQCVFQSGPILSCDWPVDVTWVSNSRNMRAARDRFKIFRFSVMQSTFSFCNIEIMPAGQSQQPA